MSFQRLIKSLIFFVEFTCSISGKQIAGNLKLSTNNVKIPRLQLSDSFSSSPAEQAKSPAELELTNSVIHIYHINYCSTNVKLFIISEIVKSTRNQRQIEEKSRNLDPRALSFSLLVFVYPRILFEFYKLRGL